MKRRLVGGYEWRDRLEQLTRIGERMTSELVEMSKYAPTVEASRRYMELVALSSLVQIKTLELREYQVKDHEPTTSS